MRIRITTLLLILSSYLLNGQGTENIIKSIFDAALTDQTAYRHLEYLCKNTKGRLPGSAAAAEAAEYTQTGTD